jgi:hypothetical protein
MSKEKGKIKIRFFEVELEGSDDTLLESVRSAAALANRSHVRVTKMLAAPSAANVTQEEPQEEAQEAEEEAATVESSDRPKKGRAYATPQVVDVDLKSGDMPFEKFAHSAAPNDTTKKYLVIAVWMKRYRSIPKITIDHIWTCSRVMGWGTQKDMNQPLRDGKRNGYFKGNSEGWEVTHIGETAVDNLINKTE